MPYFRGLLFPNWFIRREKQKSRVCELFEVVHVFPLHGTQTSPSAAANQGLTCRFMMPACIELPTYSRTHIVALNAYPAGVALCLVSSLAWILTAIGETTRRRRSRRHCIHIPRDAKDPKQGILSLSEFRVQVFFWPVVCNPGQDYIFCL